MSAELPVGVVGIGCKLPNGCDSKELYYNFLRQKGDGMTQPPPDRWVHNEWNGRSDEPGKYNTNSGGYISEIELFDPLEFGISTKEAQTLDPSLRIALEVAYQALQDSGIDYRGSNTGVYFAQLLTSMDELEDDRYEIGSSHGTGRCIAIRANRVSFTFDLRGPSLVTDTACSSSGTAMHLALSAIRLGEIDQALILGASTLINPKHTLTFSKLGVLSSTGSSKSFDASADGYARSEGFAAVLVKRLDAAVRDGDHVYSVLSGSSINSNGRGKSLTMPEGEMQSEAVKKAYAIAKRNPSDACYVELHATGTLVGDPIEANAAGKVFSAGRGADRILRVGSVKANIGHTEGCSFLASLIKVSLMLDHQEFIPNIRFNNPNPKIDFSKGMMKVQTEVEPMTPEMTTADGKWITSISSYGVGGSNAHVVVESFATSSVLSSEVTAVTTQPPILRLFTVGALTETSLERWKIALVEHFGKINNENEILSLSRELTRQARSCTSRTFAIASSLGPDIKFSKPVMQNPSDTPKLCLVFSGQGPQHIFMGRELSAAYPAFLRSIQQNDHLLVHYGLESMLTRTGLFVPGKTTILAANGLWPVADVVFSIVFFQMALVDLIKSLGIEFDFVVGHSIGEIAMGYASGHYDREMAVGIAVARAAAMTKAEGNGSMVALGVGVVKAQQMIRKVLSAANVSDGLWVAGINSPQAVTVAGKEELVDAMVKFAAQPEDKVFAAKLRVTCAFHTPLMQPQESTFKTMMPTTVTEGRIDSRVMSTVDGNWLDRDLDADYCWDNIRRPVRFAPAINRIIKSSSERVLFLEIAPHPVLKAYIEQCGGDSISLVRRPNLKIPSQNTGEQYQFLEGIGNILMTGYKGIDLDLLYPLPHQDTSYIKTRLPDYPYNRSVCWSESNSGRSKRLYSKPGPIASQHFRLSIDTHPDLAGHVIFKAPLFPASGYIESVFENGAMAVKDIHIHKPLVLSGSGEHPAHAGCIIDGDKWEFRASTTNQFDNGSIILDTLYASGTFSKSTPLLGLSNEQLDFIPKLSLSSGSITGDGFYKAIPSAYGYHTNFSNSIKVIHEVPDADSWDGKAYLARLVLSPEQREHLGSDYVIHPGILDSIIQVGLAICINMETKNFDFNGVFLPVKADSINRLDSAAPIDVADGLWVYSICRNWSPTGPFKSDYIVANSEGRVVLTIEGLEMTVAPGDDPIVITDDNLEERLTTCWESRDFPSDQFSFPDLPKRILLPSSPCSLEMALAKTGPFLSQSFKALALSSHVVGGRHTLRVADINTTPGVAQALDNTLLNLSKGHRVTVDYYCAAPSADAADQKTKSLQYPHTKSMIIDLVNEHADESQVARFDILLLSIDLSVEKLQLNHLAEMLVPGGVVLSLVHDSSPSSKSTSMDELSANIEFVFGTRAQMAELPTGTLITARLHASRIPKAVVSSSDDVIFHHFSHGSESQLAEIVTNLSPAKEIWILGNDDAAGIGAMGLALCLTAENEFNVHSVLFEDHTIDKAAREAAIHQLRLNPSLLEQSMKISRNGNILVRRLVCGTSELTTTAPNEISEPAGTLFSAHKSYILIGGSSELGVRISDWMARHGARHLILTSRRGTKALSKVDTMYVQHLRQSGVEIDVMAADATSERDTAAVLERASEMGPVGGVFLMTVVLIDAKFCNLTQKIFDDVYESKVTTLNTLLACVNPTSLDFLLLFSTYGSVFGNAGQAAYCASQLYLDRIADTLPNTISMSLPPITDAGVFRRLTSQTRTADDLARAGMTTSQLCNFIGDALIRPIRHYVPILDVNSVPDALPYSEPRLYSQFLSQSLFTSDNEDTASSGAAESPASLLAALVGLSADQITENALITSFGLDSLSATRYSKQLKSQLGIEISQIELLGSTTIGSLNDMKGALSSTASTSSDDNGDQDSYVGKYGDALISSLDEHLGYDEPYITEASPRQHSIVLAQIESSHIRDTTTQHNTYDGFFIKQSSQMPFNAVNMGNALNELVQRHGALRTSFYTDKMTGKLMQIVHPSAEFEAPLIDLRATSDAPIKAYEMFVQSSKQLDCSLEHVSLLKAMMFLLPNDEWAVAIAAHRLIIDQASFNIIFTELMDLYSDGTTSLPPVKLHYTDYSDWLIRTAPRRNEIRDQQLAFWAEYLKELEPLRIPLAVAQISNATPSHAAQINAVIDHDVFTRYCQLTQGMGLTPFAGFLAAYNVLLFKYSSQSSFAVGTVVNRRNIPQLTSVVGLFSDALPIQTTVDASQSFSEYLESFGHNLTECLSHDDVAYEDIVSHVKSNQSPRLFRHLFSEGHTNLERSEHQSGRIETRNVQSSSNGMDEYEFSLAVHSSTGDVDLFFNSHLISEQSAGQFLNAYIGLIEALGSRPELKIKEVSTINQAEHRRHIDELLTPSTATFSTFDLVKSMPEYKSGSTFSNGKIISTSDISIPRSHVEKELLSMFTKSLQMNPGSIDVQTDLFVVGLSPLLAVQAAGTILDVFNVHIGLATIYSTPTIRELGDFITGAMRQEIPQIINVEQNENFSIELLPINRRGIDPRLFIVHDVSGMATPFMRLAPFLENQVYALGDPCFGAPSGEGFSSVNAIADHYISLLRSVQPSGPYHIAGYSFGATVALCMASKLAESGEQVERLVLFDPMFIPTAQRQSIRSSLWTQQVVDGIVGCLPGLDDQWKRKLEVEITKNMQLLAEHEAEFYDGKTTLVVPKDRSWYRSGHMSVIQTCMDERNGWDQRLSKLDLKVSDGRHETMFAPSHIQNVAEVLKDILNPST